MHSFEDKPLTRSDNFDGDTQPGDILLKLRPKMSVVISGGIIIHQDDLMEKLHRRPDYEILFYSSIYL